MKIGDILWGPFSCILLLGISLYLSVKFGFFYFRHPIKSLKYAFSAEKGSSSSAVAMLTSLGGCIGVGNIVGVSVAVSLGGAGAIFWMCLCGITVSVLKYTETVLSVKYRRNGGGGPMYVLEKCTKTRLVPILFCIACIASSFGIGASVQSNSVAVCFEETGVPRYITGIVLVMLCGISVFASAGVLKKISSAVVPVMSIIYIAGAVFVIIANRSALADALSEIIKGAFGFDGAAGGFSGAVISAAVKQGMAKGIFSAESGMGSSPIIYSSDRNAIPCARGILGVFETFFDTVILCTLTGLVIVSSGEQNIWDAFSSVFGGRSILFCAVSLFFFAYTSICCWNFYGKTCLKYISAGKIFLYVYNASFCAAVFLGAVAKQNFLWEASDIFNALMMWINIYGILCLSNECKELTDTIGFVKFRKESRKVFRRKLPLRKNP